MTAPIVIRGTGDHARVILELLRAGGRVPLGFVKPIARVSTSVAVDGSQELGSLAEPKAWLFPGGGAFVVVLGADWTSADRRAFAPRDRSP